jgi:hexosaminidase
MKALGLKNEEELQSYFIRRMDQFLTANGRRLIGWDEILEGGLAPGATVMSWRGIKGGIAAARAGHDVVMAPTTHTYFDYYQAKTGEPLALGGFLPLATVYDFEPIPPELTAEEGRRVLGAQGQLWTEYINNPDYLEYMAFPRMSALAEVVWTPKARKDFTSFLSRMRVQEERLRARGVKFRPLDKK